ncbi:trans-aconitate 2-methyltransferase [Rhizobium sp. Leaf341]|uniref:trans-aconitate 2-methyltransferase n=1 Tax=Rhizobium sp. Leaf341 TaxID=1736344 RepID=UPI000712BB66|nr:trans-aconitate 2-methyltransferase [Rhizobium sp. Leaf341]KQR78225.1 trans-aconitate methyltransferase [Rhizobium sp. Leaf341]
MRWSAAQYLAFEDERTRPARDLLAQVPPLPEGALFDIGCGPGNSTELVASRFPDASLSGIDSDADMLAAARRRLPDVPFHHADLTDWEPDAPPALIFANAVLQWMPDPAASIERLARMLARAGVLAVQMPDNLNEPTHRAMRDIAAEPIFAEAYGASLPNRSGVATPERLIDLLSPIADRVDVWHTIYHHRLTGAESIVDWVKGTGLRPYLAPLPEALRQEFLLRYLERIRKAYPPLSDGRVLLRFPRLFLVAVRKGDVPA